MKYFVLIIVSALTFWMGYSIATYNADRKHAVANLAYILQPVATQTINSLKTQRDLCKKQLEVNRIPLPKGVY